MKNRKIVVVGFLLVAALLLGIGYAALTDTLTIIGNAHVDMDTANKTFDERIYFSAAEVITSEGTGTGTTDDVVSFSADDATYTANKLAITNEKSVFKFTITNDSNVDAVISVNATKLSGAENPSNTNADKFTVTYAYYINDELVEDNLIVAKQGGTIDVKVTVTLIEPVTNATSATFGIELTATSIDPE